MLRRFWLFFAQAVTVLLALMFIVVTLAAMAATARTARQAARHADRCAAGSRAGHRRRTGDHVVRRSRAKAMPAVVNVFSSKDGSLPPDPRAKDPLFRYFFGDRNARKQQDEPAANLGSGVIVVSKVTF